MEIKKTIWIEYSTTTTNNSKTSNSLNRKVKISYSHQIKMNKKQPQHKLISIQFLLTKKLSSRINTNLVRDFLTFKSMITKSSSIENLMNCANEILNKRIKTQIFTKICYLKIFNFFLCKVKITYDNLAILYMYLSISHEPAINHFLDFLALL